MAKKTHTDQPVYEEAVLKISKEDFIEKLRKQISEGNRLLGINVPVVHNVNFGYGGFSNSNEVTYEETAQKQFIQQFSKWHDYNILIYKTSFTAANNTFLRDYESKIWVMYSRDIVKHYKDDIERLIGQMESDIERCELIPCRITNVNIESKPNVIMESPIKEEVFIVHGHNDSIKYQVARFLEKLNLEAIILHEVEDGGKTIIEKFEINAEKVKCAVILLTCDDLGISKKDRDKAISEKRNPDYKDRARQNVILEMGYFMGKYGRERVFILLENGIEKPGDVDGVVYTPIDSEGAWKMKLASRLKYLGYSIDMNKLLS